MTKKRIDLNALKQTKMKTFILGINEISEIYQNKELIYFDIVKKEMVKIFVSVKPYYDYHTMEKQFTCEYLTGPEKGNWTQSNEKNLIKL